ncbi:hypothetical protein P171DRAFT_362221 [Karstenula rhodostoma CBS 690.94]|uniref:MYND-type domain-containing protein n=1 Tax=Karstenula rhodostoma CBS 690.94 TaxID=1392251 RepID=A0A9P4U9C5_9PLEO|nr:hypothetical protein P171DRAFT_362221 [Karstenula rhodostoma CBS 690.94]
MADYSEDYRDYERWNPYGDPSPFDVSTELVDGCSVCDKDGLIRCAGCRVVHYCRRVHQYAHRKQHKSVCLKIKKAQEACDKEEAELRAGPNGPPGWGNPLEDRWPRLFWGIHPMRQYLSARFAVVELQMKINTRAAVQAALDNIIDMLRLRRGDDMWLRDIAPGLFLRLDRDQACYDFVKWWTWRFDQRPKDIEGMGGSYTDIKNADMFEAPDLFINTALPLLTPLLAVTLLKIRRLIDLQAIQRVKLEAGPYVPQEIQDLITAHAVSPVVAANRNIFQRQDHVPKIEELKRQIRRLYDRVLEANKYVWPAMVRPGNHLTATPRYAGTGTIQEMQTNLPYIYNAWSETPGAIGVIEELQKCTVKS